MYQSDSIRMTRTSSVIPATAEAIYQTILDPEALVRWQTPGEMTARIHSFDAHVGGGYEMSLFYPESDDEGNGKTSAREDRYSSRFRELIPYSRITQAIEFGSEDPAIQGEFTMTVILEPVDEGTEVTFVFEHLPPGISLEDNEAGTKSSLEKLGLYVAAQTGGDRSRQYDETGQSQGMN